jgi:hypothetical protein
MLIALQRVMELAIRWVAPCFAVGCTLRYSCSTTPWLGCVCVRLVYVKSALLFTFNYFMVIIATQPAMEKIKA